MTLRDAINEVDNLKPNMYGMQEKIKWLSRLDTLIFQENLLNHRLSDEEAAPFLQEGKLVFDGYTEDDVEKELLVGEPYDDLYRHWLSAQVDWNNMEYDGFNASNAMFESVYGEFRKAFNRTHRPLGRQNIYY